MFFVGHKPKSLGTSALKDKADWLIFCIVSQIKLSRKRVSVWLILFPAASELSLKSTYVFVSTVKAALVGSAE